MNISCIIPALNEENNIGALIKSILAQELGSDLSITEIIVVDNGSTDSTVAIAEGLGANVHIKPNYNIGGLRNYGARIAKGEILVFLDADNILTENVIANLYNNLVKDNVGAIGIPLRPYKNPTWVENIWFYHIHTYSKGLNVANHIASGAFGIKKELFISAGGFDERLTVGEDTELSLRIKSMGKEILLDPNCVVYNNGFPKTIIEFSRKEIWHGDSIKSIAIHRNLDYLTVYFILCLLTVIFAILSLTGVFPLIGVILPVLFIGGPSLVKAYNRTMKVNKVFLQLSVIYMVYIFSRTLSLIWP